MPHQKLNFVFVLADEFIPGEARVLSLQNFINIPVEDEFHHLILIVNRHLKNLELDNLAIAQAISNELEVCYRLIPIQVFILVLYLEY